MQRKRPLIGLLAAVLALTLFAVAPVPPAHAADIRIEVTSTADLPDSNPGDRKCENKGLFNTGCSLRAAIMEANASLNSSSTSRHEIVVPAGTYTLTRNGAEESQGETGDLDFRRAVLIRATGGRAVIRGESGWDDRIFDIREGARVELRSLDVIGGDIRSFGDTIFEVGGGIRVETDARLELNNTVVSGNRAVRGGGVGVQGFGTLTLIGATIRDNVATRGGGGIANSGTLDAEAGTNAVMANTADSGDGGGILNEFRATAVLGGAIINGNRVLGHDGEGGGLLNKGTLTITGGILTGNAAQLGGGLVNEGTATLTRVTLRFNRAAVLSSAPGATLGGAILHKGSSLTLRDSALISNSAEAAGGGIHATGTLTITNTTISGNTAGRANGLGGLVGGFGGGLVAGGTASLNNVTIASNRAGDRGGGIVTASLTVNVKNTIIGNNTSGQGADCSTVSSTGDLPLVSQGFNLIEDVSGCTLAGSQAGNVTGQDPQLQSLLPNGVSHLPSATSPAVDAGSPLAPGSGGTACEPVDQLGVQRPLDGDGKGGARCDIGAVERQPTA